LEWNRCGTTKVVPCYKAAARRIGAYTAVEIESIWQEGFSMSRWFKSEMTEKQRLRWKKRRKRGEVIYVLSVMFVTSASVCAFHMAHGAYVDHVPLEKLLWDAIWPTVDAAFSGFIGGIWEWHSTEKRYLRAKKQNPTNNEISLNSSDCLQRGTLNGNEY
jgi:hypothetical protein